MNTTTLTSPSYLTYKAVKTQTIPKYSFYDPTHGLKKTCVATVHSLHGFGATAGEAERMAINNGHPNCELVDPVEWVAKQYPKQSND